MSQHSPILSIIIPVYNVENYLRECLDSVLQQNTESLEIICVNDGSIDGSLNILNEFEQQYPALITVLSQTNQGQAAARNAALDIARGEYVAFLDSDDYYMPNAIDTILKLISDNRGVDVIYTDCAQTTSGERFYTLPFDKPVSKGIVEFYDWEYEKYNKTPMGCVCGGVYKLAFLNQHQLRMRSGVYYEDELYIYSIYTHHGKTVAVHLEEPYYHYRTGREGSTITSLKMKNFIDRLTVVREMHTILMQSTCKTIARQHKIFEMYLQNLIEAYQHGFIKEVGGLMRRQDVEYMAAGAVSTHEKKLIRLLRISPRLMAAYKTNQLPGIVRRSINIFIK